ncbi:MAG: histidine kinase, partial [Chitinophagaceae bacterium]
VVSIWYLLFFTIYPVIFYLNLELLFPRLFLRKKTMVYFLIFAASLLIVFLLRPFDNLMKMSNHRQAPGLERTHNDQLTNQFQRGNRVPPGVPPGNHGQVLDIMSIILFTLTWSVSTGLGVFRQWRNTEQKVLKAEAEKANAELSFLRAQVNPHFLFNTLNNIYSMAVTKNPATADSIMKLSNIMRYVTDEGKDNFVNLDSEIDCLRDYIDLHRIRLGNTTTVNFTVTGDPRDLTVAPLLLMTFVENAFKYGTSNHETSQIDITLLIDTDRILFRCSNKLFETARDPDRVGIGIENAQRRLNSMYNGRHRLLISKEAGFYVVELSLVSLNVMIDAKEN